jgi:hypothetical protein
MSTTDFESELKRIDEFIDKIGDLAEEDGQITKDEMIILDGMMNDLSDYRLLVMEALDDGQITNEEQREMQKLKESILQHINNIAMADGDISNEEKFLIDRLNKFFEE